MSIKQRLIDLICEEALCDSDDITLNSTMEDLGVTEDVEWACIVDAIDEEFEIEMSEEDSERLRVEPFRKLLEYVEEHA